MAGLRSLVGALLVAGASVADALALIQPDGSPTESPQADLDATKEQLLKTREAMKTMGLTKAEIEASEEKQRLMQVQHEASRFQTAQAQADAIAAEAQAAKAAHAKFKAAEDKLKQVWVDEKLQVQELFDERVSCDPNNRVRTVSMFEREFKKHWAGAVSEAFEGLGAAAYLTLVEGRTETLFRNWAAQANQVAGWAQQNWLAVSVALDKKGFEACRDVQNRALRPGSRLSLSCVSLADWLPSQLFAGSSGKPAVGSCAFSVILWAKPLILKAAMVAAKEGVLMIDTDIILHKNLIPHAREAMHSDADVTIVTGREPGARGKYWGLNSGMVWVEGARSGGILSEWITRNKLYVNDPRGDQAALQELFKDTWFRRGSEDDQLRLFKLGTDVIGQCARKGEYATHYNCREGASKSLQLDGGRDVDDVSMARMAAPSVTKTTTKRFFPLINPQDKMTEMRKGGDWLLTA